MAVFSNKNRGRFSVAGVFLFVMMGVGGWLFAATRVTTPAAKTSTQAPISAQN